MELQPGVATEATESPGERVAIEVHRRGNRWMHWINFPLLTVMVWSGLRIYWADTRDPVGVGIGGWHWFDLFPDWFNDGLGLERRLARGLAFQLTFGWFLTPNGVAFGLYLWRTGGWRTFIPTGLDLRTMPAVLLHDLKLRPAPSQGKYNGVQQLAYTGVLAMGAVIVVSGFAIFKPTQLAPLTTVLGGYESARTIHFWVTIGFVGFFLIHILQVGRAGAGNLWAMISGYRLLPAPGTGSSPLDGPEDDQPTVDRAAAGPTADRAAAGPTRDTAVAGPDDDQEVST